MATLQEITDRFRQAVGGDAGLGRSVKFVLKGDGVVHVDGASVTNDDLPADLTLTLTRADLEALGKRQLDPMGALFTGRLKVSNIGLAMQIQPRLQALFDRAA